MLKRWRMFPSCTSCILKITWHTSLSPHAHALQQPQVCLDDDQILHLCRFSIDYVKTWNHWFQLIILNFCSINLLWEPECDIPVPGIPGPGNFAPFWMVPVPVPEKIGPGKKYRYRYRKNLVPEKSTGPGTGKNWSRYRKIPGNSRSLYIFISSCTFRHWEKEMSL